MNESWLPIMCKHSHHHVLSSEVQSNQKTNASRSNKYNKAEPEDEDLEQPKLAWLAWHEHEADHVEVEPSHPSTNKRHGG